MTIREWLGEVRFRELAILAVALVGALALIGSVVMEKRARDAQEQRAVHRTVKSGQRVTRQIAVTVRHNCREIERLKTQVRLSIKRARKTLPTIAYYREHQSELQAQLRVIGKQLREFRRRRCGL